VKTMSYVNLWERELANPDCGTNGYHRVIPWGNG
jgi:hypothetical protein